MTVQIPTQTLGNCAYQAIEKHVKRTLKYEEDVLKDRDPESLHQMRVGMRRLRTDSTGFAAAIDLPKPARDRQIGKIARTLGKLRDIDVMQEALLDRYRPNLPKKERRKIEPALATLADKRETALQEVRELLNSKDYKKFKKSVKQWLDRPTYKAYAKMPVVEVLPDILLPSISDLLLESGWWVGAPANWENGNRPHLTGGDIETIIATEGDSLHELRKQAKRVRYLMTLFVDLYGPTYQAYLADMKQLQEVLGNIQDSCIMGEFLSEVFHCDLAQETPAFAELLEQTRYEAWQQWQTLQVRYLSAAIRRDFHLEILRGFESVTEIMETDTPTVSV
ncbi:MAG: CHAD domain-containing protein [Cyanobacteria bacterium SBC]|nr:CHAD domain-containing protein [Cyanobacteria bacterium SBC]